MRNSACALCALRETNWALFAWNKNLFVTISRTYHPGSEPLKGAIPLLIWSTRSFFSVKLSLPFLWIFKVFAVFAKDFSTGV